MGPIVPTRLEPLHPKIIQAIQEVLSTSNNELNSVNPDTLSYISSISKAFILPTFLSIITFILTISLKDQKII